MAAQAEIVICGAGLAGIAAAYHLSVEKGITDILLVDERPPMTLTSDKSTECYRNWWPGPGDTMVRFMNRSIDLLEELADESSNFFGLNRRGYVFLTADAGRAQSFQESAEKISSLGAGPIRIHENGSSTYRASPPEGYKFDLDGADILLGSDLIRRYFPFITKDVVAMLNPRRCGWLSAQQLGMYMLDRVKDRGGRQLNGEIVDVTLSQDKVSGVKVLVDSEYELIQTECFVNAAGPYIQKIASMIGIELPVINELHGKISFNDSQHIVPRHVPLMIWSDPVKLPWSDEEREELAADDQTRWLVEEFPAGVHFRPEGLGPSPVLLILWTYEIEAQEPIWPPSFDDFYPEIVLRGLTSMVPGLATYINRMGKPIVDGGYYCKTRENRPLIGPLPVDGAYIIGALSGYGVMACSAAGELLAQHISGDPLPDYADDFLLSRYRRPAYQQLLANWDPTTGQL